MCFFKSHKNVENTYKIYLPRFYGHSTLVLCTRFHRNRSRNTESAVAGLLASLRRLWRHWASSDASDAQSATDRSEFHENVTNSSVVDATSRDVRVERSSWLGQEGWEVFVTVGSWLLVGQNCGSRMTWLKVAQVTFMALSFILHDCEMWNVVHRYWKCGQWHIRESV